MNDTMIDQCEIHPIRARLEEIQTEIYGPVPDMLTPEKIKYLDDTDDRLMTSSKGLVGSSRNSIVHRS